MIKNKMPLLLIGEVIDKLKKAKYFKKLDFIWGYNSIQIKKEDKWKVAFLTNKSLFEPKVIYFRLCNLPEIFQRMINSIFRELLHKEYLQTIYVKVVKLRLKFFLIFFHFYFIFILFSILKFRVRISMTLLSHSHTTVICHIIWL